MTKKDFKLVAKCLHDARTKDDAVRLLATTLALHCATFDQQKFLDACKGGREPSP